MPRPKKGKAKQAPRPKIPIDWNQVDDYLEAGCSGLKIAAILGISPETLYERCLVEKGYLFSVYSCDKKSYGEAKLELQQFQEALGIAKKKGNTQLLLMLGQERLGQGKKKIDTSEMSKDDWRKLIKDIEGDSGVSQNLGSPVENQQSLLDQGQPGQSHQVQTELGATSSMERSSSLQDSSESETAGHNDVFMPNFP